VKSGASHQWKSYSKCLAFSSTKTENQSTTRATRILDSGIKCNIENILRKEIQTPINTTGIVENTVESPFSTRPSATKESHVKNFQSDNGDNLIHIQIQTETNSHINANLIENQCEKEKCSIERRDSNTSSNYEKISITDYIASTHNLEVSDKTVSESIAHIYKIEKNSPIPLKTITKSQSVNDLAIRKDKNSFVGYLKQDAASVTSNKKDVSSWHKKKKRRFTRNVLHYVPRHLKQPKKKKKKLKKKHALSNSLSSLRSLQTASFSSISDSYAKTRNVSRDELRSVIISSPTNFVHVASATNPGLIQNSFGLDLEQIVITHQQICATLPLLVRKDERHKNGNIEQPKVTTRMSVVDNVRQIGQNQSTVGSGVAGTFS